MEVLQANSNFGVSIVTILNSLGVFVYYKTPGEAEAVEFTIPARLMFEGIDLLGLPFDELTSLLQKRDQNLEVEPDGLTSYELCIGAYAPSVEEEPTAKPESIIVFEKGYFG